LSVPIRCLVPLPSSTLQVGDAIAPTQVITRSSGRINLVDAVICAAFNGCRCAYQIGDDSDRLSSIIACNRIIILKY
jgi:hypothetical protein